MYSLISPYFWIYALYFCIATFLAFFIPGQLLIRKLKLDILSEIIISITVGFVVWSLLGFVFGYLHLRNLLYPYLIVCLFVWVKQKNYEVMKKIFSVKIDAMMIAIIVIGTLIQLSSVWVNGIQVKNGLFFCCGVPDTITHLALTSELLRRFPPFEPGFSAIPLFNYHYLSNLAVADLIRIFRLPLISTQYQYMTVLFSLLYGLCAITLAKVLHLGRRFTLWFLFFLYFFGDILYLLPLILGKGLQFSLTTLENASTLWVSPPRFISLVILLSGLTLFVHWLKKKDTYSGMIMALVLGSLIGFKVYTGMFVLSGFAFLGLSVLVRKKYSLLLPIVFMFLLSSILWVLVNKDAGGLVFTGFWRFEDFIVQPVLGLTNLELARRIFLSHNNIVRAVSYDMFFAFLYIFFSSGTLLLGIFQTKHSLKHIPTEFSIVLLTGLLSTCIAGFFFIQTTGGANSSQFLISISVIGAFYASIALSWWTRSFSRTLLVLITIIVICLTSTRVIHDTVIRIQRMQMLVGAYVSSESWDAYRFFLDTKKDSVVLLENDSTLDCLFITFIGERSTYTCISGMPGVISDATLSERNSVRHAIFSGDDLARAREELDTNDISYIFIAKDKVKGTNIENLNLPKVYETSTTAIYQVVRE